MQPAVSEDPLVGLLQAFPCGVLLLRDSLAASGHFLLPWLTSAALGQGHKVVFIAAAYSPAKHQAALRKIGAPGLAAAAAARLPGQASSSSTPIVFVSPAQWQEPQPQKQQQQDVGSGQTAVGSCVGMPWLRQVYQQVEAAARQLLHQQQQQHLTVVLDSLSVLSSLVCDEQQAAALLHQLSALGEVLQVPYRLMLLAAADVPADCQLVAAAAARAHVVADISALEGRTAALDGSLTVLVRRACKAQARGALGLQQQEQQVGWRGAGRPGWLCPGSSSVWFFRAGDVGVRWLPEVHGKELTV